MRLFRKILLGAVVLGAYTSYANESCQGGLVYNDITIGHHISVSDSKGEVVYSGPVDSNGNITSLYDFKRLKNGVYTIEVNKDFEIEIHTFTVKEGIVTFLSDFKEKIFKPVFRVEEDKVLVSKLALDLDDMTIDLFYENEPIYTEYVKGVKILNRVYKLDDTLPGQYKVIIKSNNRVYIEKFRI